MPISDGVPRPAAAVAFPGLFRTTWPLRRSNVRPPAARFSLPVVLIMLLWQPGVSCGQGNLVRNRTLEPHWIRGESAFWYRADLPENGKRWLLVQAGDDHNWQQVTRAAAFDHEQLAALLSKESGTPVSATALPITGLEFADGLQLVRISTTQGVWTWNADTEAFIDEQTEAKDGATIPLFLPPSRSVDRGGDTSINVTNQLESAIELVWSGRDGAPILYHTIEPGSRVEQHTFAGHVWFIRRKGETAALAAFTAEATPTTVVFDADSLSRVRRPSRGPRRSGRQRGQRGGPVEINGTRYFVREHNLFLQCADAEEPLQLSGDGNADNTYRRDASRSRLMSMRYDAEDYPADTPDVEISPDGSMLLAWQTSVVPDRRVTYVESSPRNQLQPLVRDYPYLKPGDPIPVRTPHLFRIDTGEEIPLSNALFPNPFSLSTEGWSEDGTELRLLYNERGHQVYRMLGVDTTTGAVRIIAEEAFNTFVHYSDRDKRRHIHLKDDTMLWMSERSGYNHILRIDLNDGSIVDEVTSGEWNVREITRVDEASGQLWFDAVGIRPEQDPYYRQHCRVAFDGSDLTVLTNGNGTHEVEYSPDRSVLIDTWSRTDLPPQHVLRDAATGELLIELESAVADDYLRSRGPLPVPFAAPGRDGHTMIYGIIHFPRHMRPGDRFPVVENIYAGPHDYHVPKAFRTSWRHQHQIRDRGIIVVQIDGMGTAWRSKAFHDECYKNLRDAGFPDRIAWMKAAANEYPAMDLEHVGIYGGSAGGQNAMAALLWHHQFYDAAVADCGCHDNRMDKIWWNEQWMGLPGDESYVRNSNMENAHLLHGRLMLVVGELDRNVDPATTTQVVRKLIQADKDFDFVLVPGAGHGACETPWASRRRADFLARHLKANGNTSETGDGNRKEVSGIERPQPENSVASGVMRSDFLDSIGQPDTETRRADGVVVVGSALTDSHVAAIRKLTDALSPGWKDRATRRNIQHTGRNEAINVWQARRVESYQKLRLSDGTWKIIEQGGGLGTFR